MLDQIAASDLAKSLVPEPCAVRSLAVGGLRALTKAELWTTLLSTRPESLGEARRELGAIARRSVRTAMRSGDLIEVAPGMSVSCAGDTTVDTNWTLASRRLSSYLPILMYHRIADDGPESLAEWRVSLATFDAQLALLREHGFMSLGLDEWRAAINRGHSIPKRRVAITFDDGYRDFLTDAQPILERHGFAADRIRGVRSGRW